MHEKQLIMCLVESLTKLDFDSDWCACTQVEYNGSRLWMILKDWLLCGDYIFVVYNCRRPPAGSIYIVSQFDPLPAVEISDTRRSLVLTKKPQLRRSNSFSDTKCPNSIIIQLIEQDILGSVVVQRVILSFFFKGTFIGDFWCRFSILVANAIDTVTIAYRACTCKPTDQIFRPIVSWCQRDNTGDFDLTTKTITSTLVIDHSTASVRALKNLSSFYRLAYKFWRDCAQIGLKLQQVAIFAQQTLQRNSRQKLNHIDYLCRWPFRKI